MARSAQTESTGDLSTEARSTGAYKVSIESEVLPKDLARYALGFAAEGPAIVFSLAIVAAAVRATARKQ